jgi:hypothetical protein
MNIKKRRAAAAYFRFEDRYGHTGGRGRIPRIIKGNITDFRQKIGDPEQATS